ncbi:MAG: hypothetical protein IH934_03400 [Nanoarchaeota archaeon]|nr:hypothetical protein [Nanoarchaeota archaeon]
MWNKRGILKGAAWILLAFALLSFVLISNNVSAAKADQFNSGNLTCEVFTDAGVNWFAAGSKSGEGVEFFNWTIGTDSPGQKDKDIMNIFSFARYLTLGGMDPVTVDELYVQIANSSLSPVLDHDWYLVNYSTVANLNESIDPDDLSVLGPFFECGSGFPLTSAGPDTCSTNSSGFNVFGQKYSVKAFAFGGGVNKFGVMDVFDVRYEWCWTPLIYDANIDKESDGWGSTFNFSIKVTNPTNITNVSLWRRLAGQTYQQIDDYKLCHNCSGIDGDYLNWTVSFACSDIGEWEFKFNATDGGPGIYNYSTEASATSIRNECVDVGNDCTFEIGRDAVNLTLISEDPSSASDASGTTFELQAFDIHRGLFNITNTLEIEFNVSKTTLIDFKNVDANTTNTSGNVRLGFLPDSDFTTGTRKWYGFVDTAVSSCYNYNRSEPDFTVEITTANNDPVASDETVNGVTSGFTGGWGESWNFSVFVRDPEGDDFNVSLEVDAGPGGFVELDKKLCNDTIQPCSTSSLFNFSIKFGCFNISSAQYRFRINDNSTNEITTTARSFTIEKNDIEFVNISGNNSIANRLSNQTDLLTVRINDTDNSSYVDADVNVSFFVKLDGTNFDSGEINITTNATGHASYDFNATCTPSKHLVGSQDWEIRVTNSICYKDTTSETFNLSIKGDIGLAITTPDGTKNFTQEGTISYLGATEDDCGAALATTVVYHANTTPTSGISCGTITQVGENAFTCDNVTTIVTKKGFYNVTMFASAADHFDNFTQKNISDDTNSGLFFLFPVKKLETPTGTPAAGGWGRPDWNFSTIASSGDPDITINVTFFMEKATPNPTTECRAPTCVNQTNTTCINCIDFTLYWNRTFTSDEQGQWFFQFKMNDSDDTKTSGTAFTVTVEKDLVNITYGGTGNATTAFLSDPSRPVNLSVQVFDTDRNISKIDPAATVTFKLRHTSYTDGELTLGTNKTDDLGNATFFFNITDANCGDIFNGAQNWTGETTSSEANYKENVSQNFSITADTTGCAASLEIQTISTPKETFQFKLFVINTSIKAKSGNANNVNVTLQAPDEWGIQNRTQFLGSITQDAIAPVSWTINATTLGRFNITVIANSSNAANDTKDSSFFIVYKEFPSLSIFEPALPILVNASKNVTAYWSCDVGEYRVATLNISLNTTGPTTIRVLTYDGTKFVDVLHSFAVDTNSSIDSKLVPILENQLNANETGFCAIQIKNIGFNHINITDLFLESYYNETVVVQDILPSIGGVNTTGIEPSEELLNITVKVTSSVNLTFNISITLNITNSTGGSKNSSTHLNITLLANSTISENFLDINTTSWNRDDYTIKATVSGNITGTPERSEPFVFKYVNITASSVKYICNVTTEEFKVTIVHPFTDPIAYNVSLQLPGDWNYSGSQLINAKSARNYLTTFNITSGPAGAENATINATLNFTYPNNISKQIQVEIPIEQGGAIPILEVIRETPKLVANRTDFVSRLIVHNKGCADATSIAFTEVISTDWTAFAPKIDGSSAGVSDIPKGEIRYTSDDFGTIKTPDYKILEYKVLPPSGLSETGTFKFDLTWGDRSNTEDQAFEVKTIRYENEEQLAFDLVANGSFNTRSAEPLVNQSYNLSIKNIGDINIRNGTWNITLTTPEKCSISNHTGTFYEDTRKIAWILGNLTRGNKTVFNFKMNCTEQKRHILTVEGIKDNRSRVSFSNTTSIGCSGSSCSTVQSFTFTKPSDARYEKLSQINFSISYNWTGQNVTIGQGFVNITDDSGAAKLVWQEYSFTDSARSISSNYTFDGDEQAEFIQAARTIGVRNYVDATVSPTGNVTVEQLDYTWDLGKIFKDTQSLFVNIQPFVFVIGTPVLTSPLDNSEQASSPIVLTWDAVTAQAGGFITYSVFVDTTDATTLQTETNDTNFLFKTDEQQETFFWRVQASDGTKSGPFSETRQFKLDQCTADADFTFALNYPMSYDNVSDKITIWGSDGSDGDPMGLNESNATTFEHIFEFGKAVRGVCAVQKPAAGIYIILSKLDIGNTSSPLNRTFLKTAGESVDFGKQVQLKFNSTFIAGELTDEGSPFAGSTLSFSGTDANETNQGQLFTLNGSTLDLRDSFLLHKLTANDSTIFRLFWNGRVIAKRSSLESWFTIRFVNQNNSLEDIVITNVGEGFYPAITQFGILDTIKSRKVTTAGLILAYESNATIIALEISEVVNDIKVINYTGITNLVNAILNFSNINWTTGSFSGSINRRYDYTPTLTDADGVAVTNVSLIMLDIRGDTLFELRTDSSGTITAQTITRSIYTYSRQTGDGDPRGPHTLKVKKYAKDFADLAKEFSAATVETVQLSDNAFTTLTETKAKNQSGIIFNPPIKVSFEDEVYGNFNTTGTLNNTPITQSEFFAIFGTDNVTNNTKLTRVTDTPDANGEYSIDFKTGVITFYDNQNISDGVTPVYSYRGNITLVNGVSNLTMSNLYDFMQANLSDVITTVDGLTYTMFLDLFIGNTSKSGSVIDATASLVFKDGYNFGFVGLGGYIDLSGVTAGGGTSGGLPLNIRDSVGSQYSPGDSVEIFSFTFDSNGKAKDSTITITIRYPNATDTYVTGTSTKIETGFYRFNKILESDVPTGTYSVQIDAVAGSDEVHDTLTFKVEGTANPEVIVEVPDVVNTNTSFTITALIKSGAGIPINCDGDANITIKNTLSGINEVLNATMNNFATGSYNYTHSTNNQSTFLATVICAISGVEYTGISGYSTQDVPGGGLTPEQNQTLDDIKTDTDTIKTDTDTIKTDTDEIKGTTSGTYIAVNRTRDILESVERLVIEDPFELSAGDDNYTARILYFNASILSDPPGNISVKLYDPIDNLNKSANASRLRKGVYSFNFTTIANETLSGVWRLEAKTGGVEAISYFLVIGGPFDVAIKQLTDICPPGVTAEVELKNTGDAKDVTLHSWIEHLNGSVVTSKSETFLAPNGAQTKNPTLDLTDTGTFVFKVLLRWLGNQEAGASEQFTTFCGGGEPPSTVNITFPPNGTITTNRTPIFKWNASFDPEDDPLTYNIVITCVECSIDNRDKNTTELNFTPLTDLQFLGDDDFYYLWKVRANDGLQYGNFSEVRNITINSLVSLTLPTDTVDFGSTLGLGENDNTTDDNPPPLVLENDGNVFENVSIFVEDNLWVRNASPTEFFQFKVDNVTSEKGSFNSTASTTTFTNIPTAAVVAVVDLNFSDDTDSAEVDLKIEVPTDEPAGEKRVNITFQAVRSR